MFRGVASPDLPLARGSDANERFEMMSPGFLIVDGVRCLLLFLPSGL